eukprot:11137286-Alexandrium_andersonii.AAC.1
MDGARTPATALGKDLVRNIVGGMCECSTCKANLTGGIHSNSLNSSRWAELRCEFSAAPR